MSDQVPKPGPTFDFVDADVRQWDTDKYNPFRHFDVKLTEEQADLLQAGGWHVRRPTYKGHPFYPNPVIKVLGSVMQSASQHKHINFVIRGYVWEATVKGKKISGIKAYLDSTSPVTKTQ